MVKVIHPLVNAFHRLIAGKNTERTMLCHISAVGMSGPGVDTGVKGQCLPNLLFSTFYFLDV